MTQEPALLVVTETKRKVILDALEEIQRTKKRLNELLAEAEK